ncbi:unnamed protein product [Danaus chrysippus]|uniref:(African queen) hypothetical protein n=1 Tax=Danaus chrysippus TaxID=151541 RepID=A0A8J2MIT6_9NEOP|nr:unnamed protein product [Danaus chrysippus]
MPKLDKKRAEEANRMWASASFVGVLIIIGLPLWWKTTEVYRVALPYDEINAFDTDSHFITTELVVLANDEKTAAKIAEDIAKAFEQTDIIKLKIRHQKLSDNLHQTLDMVADEQEALEEVAAAVDVTKHNTFHVVQRRHLFQDVWIGGDRVAFFRDLKASSTLIRALSSWVLQPLLLEGARSLAADDARRVRLPSEQHLDLLMTVVHPRPQNMKVVFDAPAVLEDYIGSFVDELSYLHNFTLKSQWLHLTEFDFQAKQVLGPSGPEWWVSVDRLPLLLTQLDGRGLGTIRLAAYILPCDVTPLVLHDRGSRIDAPVPAFMSPKWGGVVLLNPSREECSKGQYVVPVNMLMGTFISQLRKLLGITDKVPIPEAYLLPLDSVSPRHWELDSLLRLRTLEQVTSAQRSLKSLAKLLGEIPNIVITDKVGGYIQSAVEHAHEARVYCELGSLVEAHENARSANDAAETAFTEPSLLALLYFPDDQKYAIYIPLFLPIMFPVILSLKNLILWFKGKPVVKEKTD